MILYFMILITVPYDALGFDSTAALDFSLKLFICNTGIMVVNWSDNVRKLRKSSCSGVWA